MSLIEDILVEVAAGNWPCSTPELEQEAAAALAEHAAKRFELDQ